MAQKKKTVAKPISSKAAAAKAKTGKTLAHSAASRAKAAPAKRAPVSRAKPIQAKSSPVKKAAEVKATGLKTATVAKPAIKAPVAKAAPKPQAKVAIPTKVAPAPAAVLKPSAAAGMVAHRAAQAQAAHAQAVHARVMPAAVAKPAGHTLTQPATPKALAEKAARARQIQIAQQAAASPTPAPTVAAASKKPVSQRHGFKTNEWIVYPSHGVGRIVGIEEQEIAGMALELFVITFEKDKMTLRVPTGKSQSVGMRKLAEDGIVKRAMETLKGKARIKRTMWSRRAQEFEAKINSGDLISIAEVVRDLYRSESQPEQSYSERQLYEAALDRMSREIAAVDKIDERGATQRITEVLSKSAKGRRAAAEEEAAEAADDGVEVKAA